MSTKIEWAQESWNPITGCTPISEGCLNCYAKRMAQRLAGRFGYLEYDPFRVTFHLDRLKQPFKWKKPRRIFVCSMGDIFHPNVEPKWLLLVLDTIMRNQQHTFIVLTKRPDIALKHLDNLMISQFFDPPLKNLWFGATVENDKHYDRIKSLLQIPAAVRFVSVEPCLSHIDLSEYFRRPLYVCQKCGEELDSGDLDHNGRHAYCGGQIDPNGSTDGLDLVICGGETGPGARPMQSDWARSLREQCNSAGVSFFFKKHGTAWCKSFGVNPKYRENRELDGQVWEQIPEVSK